MKPTIVAWLLVLQVYSLFRVSNAEITFAVDNVTELTPNFLVASVQDAVRYCSKYEVVYEELDMPQDCQLVKEYDDPFHSLVASVQMAYAEHRPLTLSPDHIWVSVLQGVALHNAQPGVQRCYKVDDISNAGSVNCNSWNDVFNDVSSYLVNSSPFPNAFQSFTTTDTKAEKLAGLAGYSRPHEDNTCYSRQMYCGIPRITLTGKPADWEALVSRVEQLLQRCDLDWWLCALNPVLLQLSEAAHGRVATDFWRNIYRFRPDEVLATGCWFVSGWIMTLYPYITSGTDSAPYMRNPHMNSDSLCRSKNGFHWEEKPTPDQSCPVLNNVPFLQTQQFPSGLAEVDFKCAGGSADDAGMGVVSGFVGYCVSQCTNDVHPVLGWLVTNKSETCHLSGSNCLHDCACSGQGKCEKGDEVFGGGLFGSFIGGIGGGGEDRKTCRCFAGYRGVDCSQKCPSYSCGEHCGEFCEPGHVCDYKLGHCAPVAIANLEKTSVPLPSSTVSHQTASSSSFQCGSLVTSALSSTNGKFSTSVSSAERLSTPTSSVSVSTAASFLQSSIQLTQTSSSAADVIPTDVQSKILVTQTTTATSTFEASEQSLSATSESVVSKSSSSIQPSLATSESVVSKSSSSIRPSLATSESVVSKSSSSIRPSLASSESVVSKSSSSIRPSLATSESVVSKSSSSIQPSPATSESVVSKSSSSIRPSPATSESVVSKSSSSIRPSLATSEPTLPTSRSSALPSTSTADSTSVSLTAVVSTPAVSPSPDVKGMSGNSNDFCRNVGALQEAACLHDFVGLVKVKNMMATRNQQLGRFSIVTKYKSPFGNSRKKFYFVLPLHLYQKPTGKRFDLEIGETHLLIANKHNASVKKVRLAPSSVFLHCPGVDIKALYYQIDISNC